MKKLLPLFILLISTFQLQAQNWQATHLTNVTYLANMAMEVHQNKLYATIFNGFTGGLFRLRASQTAWDTLSTGSIIVPRFLASSGRRLYLSSVESGVASNIYYSTDAGATYIIDTIGLPQTFGYTSLCYGLRSFKSKIIANLGSAGYWIKDTAAVSWQSMAVVTALNGGIDPLVELHDTMFAYDNSGTNTFYISGDYGANWSTRVTGLPVDYGTSLLATDEISDRIYSFGSWNNHSQYGVFYSNDHGRSWMNYVAASNMLGTNANNTQQLVKAMYGNGNTFYMALENDKNNSAPDIIGTTSGLANLAYDTLGLPLNGASGLYGSKFVSFNNQVALQLVTTDIYLKGTATIGMNQVSPKVLSIMPNPCSDEIHINAPSVTITKVQVYDMLGQLVLEQANSATVSVKALPNGAYLVKCYAANQLMATEKIIKK